MTIQPLVEPCKATKADGEVCGNPAHPVGLCNRHIRASIDTEPLRQRLHSYIEENDLTVASFSHLCQLEPLYKFFAQQTKVLSTSSIAAISQGTDIPEDVLIQLQGGHTAEEYLKPPNPEALWKKRRCPICRTFFSRPPSKPGIYCHRPCRSAAERDTYSPKTPLGIFLFHDWCTSELTLQAYAARFGLSADTITHLFRDRLPLDKTYAKLRAVFGEKLPESATANEQRREFARQLGNKACPHLQTPEVRRKRADSQRGKKRSSAWVAKWRADRADEQIARLIEAGRTHSQSQRGRALRSLWLHLRKEPQPTNKRLREWAKPIADRLDLPPAAVLAIWEESMKANGLATTNVGRQALEERHLLVVQEMESRSVTASGRAPRGFWNETAQLVDEAEGRETLGDGAGLKDWYKKHRRHCSDPALLVRGNN